MNKKHQQAFRELRDKLKQHGFILGVTHDKGGKWKRL